MRHLDGYRGFVIVWGFTIIALAMLFSTKALSSGGLAFQHGYYGGYSNEVLSLKVCQPVWGPVSYNSLTGIEFGKITHKLFDTEHNVALNVWKVSLSVGAGASCEAGCNSLEPNVHFKVFYQLW